MKDCAEQHVPAVEESQMWHHDFIERQVQECQLYLGCSQQPQVPMVDFQAEVKRVFLTETPRIG